jgi:hypothetical protein
VAINAGQGSAIEGGRQFFRSALARSPGARSAECARLAAFWPAESSVRVNFRVVRSYLVLRCGARIVGPTPWYAVSANAVMFAAARASGMPCSRAAPAS